MPLLFFVVRLGCFLYCIFWRHGTIARTHCCFPQSYLGLYLCNTRSVAALYRRSVQHTRQSILARPPLRDRFLVVSYNPNPPLPVLERVPVATSLPSIPHAACPPLCARCELRHPLTTLGPYLPKPRADH